MKKLLSLLLILLLAFSACTDQAEPTATDEPAVQAQHAVRTLLGRNLGQTYTVHIGNDPDGESILFDCEGGIVADDYSAGTITDVLTGEPRFYVIKTDSGSSLYNEHGRLVHGSEKYEYGETCIGSNVIIHETENEFELPYKLWNTEEEKLAIPDVAALHRLSDDRIMATNEKSMILGILGSDCEKLTGFPMEQRLWLKDITDGYYIASNMPPQVEDDGFTYTTELDEDGNEVTVINPPEVGEDLDSEDDYFEDFATETAFIFDKDMQQILEEDYESELRFAPDILRGEYYLRSDGAGETVCKINGGTPLLTAEEILYYDGQNGIIKDESSNLSLTSADGSPLFTGFSSIVPCVGGADTAMTFVAREGEKLMVLGRDGKVTAESQIEGLTGFSLAGEYVIYEIASGEETLAGIADLSLNTILLPEKYNSVTLFEAVANVYFAGAYVNRFGFLRMDILDKNGLPIVESLTDAVPIDATRFAACRYTRAGIMDFDGNWIKDYYIPDIK